MSRMTHVIRRALIRNRVSLDPFTIMEVETLLAPAIRGQGGVEAAVEYVKTIFAKSYVDNPEDVARKVIEEVVETCRREGCD